MSIDEATIRKVAKLARLDIPEDRIAPLASELDGIMGWIEQLNEVDIEGVEAMASTVDATLMMREDIVTTDLTGGSKPELVTKNAPKTEDHFFIVPKVVE